MKKLNFKNFLYTFIFLAPILGCNGPDKIVAFGTSNKEDGGQVLVTPSAPNSLTLFNPTVTPNTINNPTINVGGVTSGDTVKLYTNAACSIEVGSAISTGDTVQITTSGLSVGSHTFYATAMGSTTSPCSSEFVTYEVTCPSGYIPVPANAAVGVSDIFCVMKYEAKNDGADLPISQAQDTPWVSIDQVDSYAKCLELNSEGDTTDKENDTNEDGTYALISNPEWIAIGRNLDSVDENWTSGIVGQGCLKRGNVGGINPCSGVNSGYDNGGVDFGTARNDNGTAQLILDNGEVLWDLSGNVWEWVDWNLEAPLSTDMLNAEMAADSSNLASGWREYTDLDFFPTHSPNTSVLSSDSLYDTSFGVGMYFYQGDDNGGAALRGGNININAYAGIYALALSNPSSTVSNVIGFRCVFRP